MAAIETRALTRTFRRTEAVNGLTLDATWIAGAHLALLRWTRSGSVERELRVPNLTVCTHAAPGC